jgi:hypothetical protein
MGQLVHIVIWTSSDGATAVQRRPVSSYSSPPTPIPSTLSAPSLPAPSFPLPPCPPHPILSLPVLTLAVLWAQRQSMTSTCLIPWRWPGLTSPTRNPRPFFSLYFAFQPHLHPILLSPPPPQSSPPCTSPRAHDAPCSLLTYPCTLHPTLEVRVTLHPPISWPSLFIKTLEPFRWIPSLRISVRAQICFLICL